MSQDVENNTKIEPQPLNANYNVPTIQTWLQSEISEILNVQPEKTAIMQVKTPLQDSAHRPLKSSLNCDQDNEITTKTQTSEAACAANLETSLALIPLRQ